MNAKTNAVFSRKDGGKLIDRVLSFIHDISLLAFRVHTYCEPGLTPGTGYWQRRSERDTIDIASGGSAQQHFR